MKKHNNFIRKLIPGTMDGKTLPLFKDIKDNGLRIGAVGINEAAGLSP